MILFILRWIQYKDGTVNKCIQNTNRNGCKKKKKKNRKRRRKLYFFDKMNKF